VKNSLRFSILNLCSYRNETFNLLDDLLTLNPKYRPTASTALSSPYFTHGSIAKVGTSDFGGWGDSHELDSRNEKMKRFESGQGRAHLKHHYDVQPRNNVRGGFKLPSLKK
jgi:serine/threonine protein kinase